MTDASQDVAGLAQAWSNASYECGRRDGLGYNSDGPAIRMDAARDKFAAALEALRAERDERDKIIAECARAVGAIAAPECSVEFKWKLPDEIRAAIDAALAALAQERREWEGIAAENWGNCRDATERANKAERERDEAREDGDNLRDALYKIVQWADAYPLDVFPEPDWGKVREALETVDITVDSVSASNMRHVVEGVGNIARAAIDAARKGDFNKR